MPGLLKLPSHASTRRHHHLFSLPLPPPPTHHMKQQLLVSRRTNGHYPCNHEKALKFSRHYKWLLWLAFAIYLLLFFSITSSSSYSFALLPLRITSLALETTPGAGAGAGAVEDASTGIRIYVYDLPPKYNRDWLRDSRCGTHLFAAEVAIHEALLGFAGRVLDPADADFFFVPVYVSCNFSTPNGFPSLAHARPLLASAVELVSSEFPFWNRSRGRDHVFVASHDYGACFHAMEDVAVADGIPDSLKDSIILQTFGVTSQDHPCQRAEHVLIPPYVPPGIEGELPSPDAARRDIFVYFRGKMEVHPKNVSGLFYGRGVRTAIWRRYARNRKFYLQRKRFAGYRSEMARSVFCLCPLGWAPWSPRLVEAVALGCVPVIVADGIRLPFPEIVRWPEISLKVAERDVGRLEEVLDAVKATNLTVIQRNLWDPARRRALLFPRPMAEGDATWHALRALEGMRGRRSLLPRQSEVLSATDTRM